MALYQQILHACRHDKTKRRIVRRSRRRHGGRIGGRGGRILTEDKKEKWRKEKEKWRKDLTEEKLEKLRKAMRDTCGPRPTGSI